MSSTRDFSIDFLRFIGISLIIIAHCHPPGDFFQIRTFDVPLMLFVSGLAYSGRKIGNLGAFYLGRALRLLIPVYLFLAMYLPVYAWVRGDSLKPDKIYLTLTLASGIGYVWIIRVFLLVMLITPLCLLITKTAKSWRRYLILACLIAVSIIYNFWIAPWKTGGVWSAYIVPYIVAYGILFAFGNLTYRSPLLFRAICVAFFGGIAVYYAFENGFFPQKFKYPPRGLFLAYGIACSILIYSLVQLFVSHCKIPRFIDIVVSYISSRTIWIYLWHIPVVIHMPRDWHWTSQIAMAYGIALSATLIQNRLVRIYEKRHGSSWWCKYLIN